MNEQKLKHVSSLEKMLLKDSQAFRQQTDDILQKQIMAAVEKDKAEKPTDQNIEIATSAPLNIKKLTWWFSGISLAAIASFLSITLIPKMLMVDDKALQTSDIQFSVNLNINDIGKNIETIEMASFSKMKSEKEAIQKDIQSIIDAFSVTGNNV